MFRYFNYVLDGWYEKNMFKNIDFSDHFAQDRGSRPSSRPASRQGNHDSERYPLVGSEMDDFGYHTQPAPSG